MLSPNFWMTDPAEVWITWSYFPSVISCDPPLEKMAHLERRLQETNNFSAFLANIRREFVALHSGTKTAWLMNKRWFLISGPFKMVRDPDTVFIDIFIAHVLSFYLPKASVILNILLNNKFHFRFSSLYIHWFVILAINIYTGHKINKTKVLKYFEISFFILQWLKGLKHLHCMYISFSQMLLKL